MVVSTRRGSWIFNRISQGGIPNDLKMMTRLYNYLMDKLPWSVVNDFMEHRLQVSNLPVKFKNCWAFIMI